MMIDQISSAFPLTPLARYIGACVWKNEGDIRDVISIGKLVRKSEQIGLIIKTVTKYAVDGREKDC